MDLQQFALQLRDMFTKPKGVHADGISYGPAVSRWSKTPINFVPETHSPNINGYYDWSPAKEKIVINPSSLEHKNKVTTIGNTIRHESIHALLTNALKKSGVDVSDVNNITNAYRILGQELPEHYKIAQAIRGKRDGIMPVEVPAYAGQPDYTQFGISAPLRNSYTHNLVESLKGIDPDASKIYQRMTGAK